jgi:hypothetical protein
MKWKGSPHVSILFPSGFSIFFFSFFYVASKHPTQFSTLAFDKDVNFIVREDILQILATNISDFGRHKGAGI